MQGMVIAYLQTGVPVLFPQPIPLAVPVIPEVMLLIFHMVIKSYIKTAKLIPAIYLSEPA